MNRARRIAARLGESLMPRFLKLVNHSEKHQSHRKSINGEETHLALTIACDALDSLSRVQSHRKIQKLLQSEFDSGLHSLTIEII